MDDLEVLFRFLDHALWEQWVSYSQVSGVSVMKIKAATNWNSNKEKPKNPC